MVEYEVEFWGDMVMIHTIYRQIAMPGSSWGTRLEDGGNRAAIQMAEAVAGGSESIGDVQMLSLFLAASFKLLFLPNKSSSKTVPTDAL